MAPLSAKKLEELKAERASCIAEITRNADWVDQAGRSGKEHSPIELRVRLSNMAERYNTCKHIQRQIEVGEVGEIGFEGWVKAENDYIEASCIVETWLLKHEPSAPAPTTQHPSSSSDSSLMRLPQVSLDKFSGEDPTKWLSFITKFKSLVHSKSCDRTYKFELLKQSLEGEAARQIEDLELTPRNYEVALGLLEERWQSTKLLAYAHYGKLWDLETIVKADPDRLTSLVDTVRSNYRALCSIRQSPLGCEEFLAFLVLKKLDRDTRSRWDEQSTGDDMPDLQQLLKFIDLRAKTLRTNKVESDKHTQRSDRKPPKSGKSFATSGAVPKGISRSSCHLCGKADHAIYHCREFLSLSIADRRAKIKDLGLCFVCLNKGHSAKDCHSGNCKLCGNSHNTHVCYKGEPQKSATNADPVKDLFEGLTQGPSKGTATHTHSGSSHRSQYNLLSTAVVLVKDQHGQFIPARALLDGGSQFTYMTEDLRQRLGIRRDRCEIEIETLAGRYRVLGSTSLEIKSRNSSYTATEYTLVQRRISGLQPNHRLRRHLRVPENLPLADPQYNIPGRVDILLSIAVTSEVQSVGQVRLGDGLPIMQKTLFGWVLGGRLVEEGPALPFSACTVAAAAYEGFDMERFWKIEEVDTFNDNQPSAAEQRVEDFYTQTTIQREDGYYEVRLPFRTDRVKLGDSLKMAQQRLKGIERRLEKDAKLKQAYHEFMDEYLQLGHMVKVPPADYHLVKYYIPHHCVVRPEAATTKVRVVFDASSVPEGGSSLNDVLEKGPQLLQDLFGVLLRFRKWSYTVVADVEKMFRQIRVNEDDSYHQCILWQGEVYRLVTVTYGTRPAPFLAVRTILQCARDQREFTPRASEVAERDVFMDDVISGADSHEEAIDLMQQLDRMCGSGNMRLRKWASNSWNLMTAVDDDNKAECSIFDDQSYVKTLGLMYHPCDDSFRIKIDIDTQRKVTKRVIQSDIARTFDPLGLVAPVVVSMKLVLQRLWSVAVNWDESPPQDIHTDYESIRQSLPSLHDHRVSRRIVTVSAGHYEIHGFADASESAYGACVYLKSVGPSGCSVVLICAKSKVAPLKKVSLARLELMAAVLLVELLSRVKGHLGLEVRSVHCWSDSKTVLLQLKRESRHFYTFVANRVSTIQRAKFVTEWRHVPTKSNPADLVSRGVTPQRFLEPEVHSMWYNGPEFLLGSAEEWPPAMPGNSEDDEGDAELPEVKPAFRVTAVALAATQATPDLVEQLNPAMHHSAMMMLRVFAYVRRFIAVRTGRIISSQFAPFCLETMQGALHSVLVTIQSTHFSHEMALLRKKVTIKHGPLSHLNPFIDENDGLLRVGGRLMRGKLSFAMRHPAVLPNHLFTKALIRFIHYKNQHCGIRALVAIVRQQFWPINCVRLATAVVRACVICTMNRPRIPGYQMGNLPVEALTAGLRPFINVAIDFAAGIWIRQRGRGRRPIKAYVCIFVCLATHAVHLELVSDLSTSAFIAALRRFIGRRGCCRQIFCDNGTNFVGGDRELQKMREDFIRQESRIHAEVVPDGIKFRFSPASSPHFNGLAEAAVKSMKHHLRRVLGEADLTYEEMVTLLIQVESTLNSRPLTESSCDPNDFEVLTPAHFIIGEPFKQLVEPTREDFGGSLTQRFRRLGQLHKHFWDRWSHEYLTSRQIRSKWKHPGENLRVGQLVQLIDDNRRPYQWPLGRVVQTYPAEDGTVRVVAVKTKNGELRRAANRVCPLPYEQKDRKDVTKDAVSQST